MSGRNIYNKNGKTRSYNKDSWDNGISIWLYISNKNMNTLEEIEEQVVREEAIVEIVYDKEEDAIPVLIKPKPTTIPDIEQE